ncbi:hypothetical protein LS684_10900 [Cytobacillus spongiae]|uniref:hypothetical protein n=1 Tax=Cytobacillus spongiae TaxID=2901381 RepID=UPI001F16161C|nr:hypothetical protein [Cytobacillus spongiae]UII54205.1 hypothetical protein LS684_10900 [Cytobacillus spongiae]
MKEEHDFDHGEDQLAGSDLKDHLQETLRLENQLLQTYAITAQSVADEELQTRLHNMAEGNAKRVKQLEYELSKLK